MVVNSMSYATYERYKDSGVDWLGAIPSTWTTRKLKHIVKIHKRIIGHEGIDVLSITQRGIVVKDITSGAGQLAMDYSKYQIVEIGDFAMNHMDLSSVAVKPPTLGGGYKATPQSCLHTDGI